MKVEDAKKLFKKLDTHSEFLEVKKAAEVGNRYYRNRNDIDYYFVINKKDKEDPLRQADNHVSSNFHQLLVDQKAGYVAGIPPIISVRNDSLDEKIEEVLGDKYDRVFHKLVIEASNTGVAWLHVWKDEVAKDFNYANIPSYEIQPIYNNAIERELLAVRRTYTNIEDDGNEYVYDEYWTDKEVSYFRRKSSSYRSFDEYNRVHIIRDALLGETEDVNTTPHDFGRVPFIEFPNNSIRTSDLNKNKGLIDLYDKVFNGFADDLEDVQQVVLVLTGYEGQDLLEFKRMLKQDKAIKLEGGPREEAGGVAKLTIDIPVEARNSFLDRVRDDIFIKGQGVNPNKVELGNNSGVAIKMLFSQLELKAASLETEFRPGINQLVRFILQSIGKASDKIKIDQTWTRASISNELEKAQVLAQLADITSAQNLAKNNPLVEDWQEELSLREEASDSFKGGDYELESEEGDQEDQEKKKARDRDNMDA